MSNTIRLKRSSTASDTPTASDLEVGELAINTADAKLFTKHTDNTIKEISGSGGGGSGLSNIVEDTTPQLGGDLDTNEKTITMDSGKNINFGTGSYTGFINYNSTFNPYGNSNGTFTVSTFGGVPLRLAGLSESNYLGSNLTTSNVIETNNTESSTPLIVRTNTGSATDNLFKIDYQGTATFEKGVVDIKNDGSQSELRMYCESNNAHYAALQAPAHSAFSGNVTLTLPATTSTLLSTTSNLADLANVASTSPSTGEVLKWNGSAWEPAADSTGSGGGSGGNADTVDNYHLSVVASMPSSPDSNTIYFVTG